MGPGNVAPGPGPSQVSLRTPFERFPATVKGAFVFRGEDRDPHQVKLMDVRLVRVPGGEPVRRLPVDPLTTTVPPRADVFVPFETSVADLAPGWYGFEVDAEVDGAPRTLAGDRRFSSAWPRGTMRSGVVRVDRDALAGSHTVTVERLQCTPDGVVVRFAVRPPAQTTLSVRAGDGEVDVLQVQVDQGTGDASAQAYPLPRRARTVTLLFDVGGPDGGRGEVSIGLE